MLGSLAGHMMKMVIFHGALADRLLSIHLFIWPQFDRNSLNPVVEGLSTMTLVKIKKHNCFVTLICKIVPQRFSHLRKEKGEEESWP